MTSALTPITDLVTNLLLSQVLPAVLTVLNVIIVLAVAVWGSLRVLSVLNNDQDPEILRQKFRRIFSEFFENQRYETYKKKRDLSEERNSFRNRYDQEADAYDRGL